jgi:hypothetical protein
MPTDSFKFANQSTVTVRMFGALGAGSVQGLLAMTRDVIT